MANERELDYADLMETKDDDANALSRRQFIEAGGLAAAALGLSLPVAEEAEAAQDAASALPVVMEGDGLSLSPAQSAAQLAKLCAAREPAADTYGLGGIVEEAEAWFARALGKERCLFMPSGTLANQLALRALAGERRRVVVQEVSHVYNDTGDAGTTLSGLTLLPLAPERATFTWTDVERALARTRSGRVAAEIGAISIESPVRRRSGELFDRTEMLRICGEARQRGIGLHLDGARLFVASACTGIAPAEYAAPFDTVYVSLWKYFNALNGAVLAGPARLLEDMFHVRRMYGGALFNAWPFVLLARHYAEGFTERFRSAMRVAGDFQQAVAGKGVRVERIANGTNIFRIAVPPAATDRLQERLRVQGVVAPAPVPGQDAALVTLTVNETWNRATGAALADRFRRALAPG